MKKKKKKPQNNKKPPSKSKSGIHAKNLREKSLNMISYWNHNEGGSGDIFVPYITEKSWLLWKNSLTDKLRFKSNQDPQMSWIL